MTLAIISDWMRGLRLRLQRLGVLGIAGGIALVCATVSAHAAYKAIAASQTAAPAPTPRPIGYETEDHFPGAAYFYVAEESAAPASGATGTAALPDLPVPAEAETFSADTSVRAAPPFSMRLASATDRGRALQCLATAIYYEAATEPDAGQQAVAQVILNRVRHPAFPSTVCGVIYQGSERTTGCQFSYACDGAMARLPAKTSFARALRAAAAALNGHVYAPAGMATHYHTYAVTPSWNRSLVMTAVVGAHFFHRWKGYWGTPAAFRQAYIGQEPVPGPHARPVAPAVAPVTLALNAAVAPAPSTAAAVIQPAYAQSSLARPVPVKDALPAESQILDRWKDSGTPLR